MRARRDQGLDEGGLAQLFSERVVKLLPIQSDAEALAIESV